MQILCGTTSQMWVLPQMWMITGHLFRNCFFEWFYICKLFSPGCSEHLKSFQWFGTEMTFGKTCDTFHISWILQNQSLNVKCTCHSVISLKNCHLLYAVPITILQRESWTNFTNNFLVICSNYGIRQWEKWIPRHIWLTTRYRWCMMTSSNWEILALLAFCAGNSPLTNARDKELWCFLWSASETKAE